MKEMIKQEMLMCPHTILNVTNATTKEPFMKEDTDVIYMKVWKGKHELEEKVNEEHMNEALQEIVLTRFVVAQS
jgi:uncharacterized hydantoinase/oxoprolinase family protein